jgi:hypothetical protein
MLEPNNTPNKEGAASGSTGVTPSAAKPAVPDNKVTAIPTQRALDGEIIAPDPRATRINSKHREALNGLCNALKAAMDCGDDLRKVKASLRHGEFGSWLRDNTALMPRTAQEWMSLAEHRKQIEAAMNHDGLNSIVGALRLIRQSPDPKPESTISEDAVVSEIIKKVQTVLGKEHQRGIAVAARIVERLKDMRLVD